MIEIPVQTRIPRPVELVQQLKTDSLTGLKVLFINMPLRESARPNIPPQGPGLLAARLRLYGAEPTIIDLNAYRIQDKVAEAQGLPYGRHITLDETRGLLARHLHKYGEPRIIALSGMITTLRWQERIVDMCRSLVPDAFIISGGGLATDVKAGLFQWMPELDAIAHSEGDDVILILAHGVKTGTLDESSPYCVGAQNGRLRFLFAGDRPENLDELPFAAWDLFHEDVDGNAVFEWYIQTPVWGGSANNSSATPFSMERSLTTVSSRGCPYACGFCDRQAQGERNYGMRDASNMVREAEWLVDTYHIDFLGFPDDNFAVDPRRVRKLPEAFAHLGGLRWGTHTRLDEIDARAFDMAKSGCIYIGVGAESAAVRTLESMNKGGFILRPRGSKENQLTHINGFFFPTTMVRGIETAQKAGIHVNCTWIMAYPEETLEDLKTSVAFILWQEESLPSSAVNRKMFVATAYPGTEMFRHPKVQRLISEHFGVHYQGNGVPIADDAFRAYLLELDDATKVMYGRDGAPLNFGEMSDDMFLQAQEHLNADQIEKILDM
ncbi:MAG: hypothetical protein A3G60_03020 [Candidatus Ryanbacteria bacterium RIFCSPLOWO2_12_FULL_47_9c]|uniref:Radical SAM core domain-containing protein n=1 Tax=Candidatus Ryanbacteria bacterium RIFCSPLOWO2_12_FULL_47_9c TaxID=1802131 RepID=A0A1G2H1Y2_9BACT|nr:MAG: hypothetical protein A3G60_03020 [Candidatus Ryanbacteria bacterium RIFCSPLOWO2_12_FULL_47_9c]